MLNRKEEAGEEVRRSGLAYTRLAAKMVCVNYGTADAAYGIIVYERNVIRRPEPPCIRSEKVALQEAMEMGGRCVRSAKKGSLG